jgi:hypothetical protein
MDLSRIKELFEAAHGQEDDIDADAEVFEISLDELSYVAGACGPTKPSFCGYKL